MENLQGGGGPSWDCISLTIDGIGALVGIAAGGAAMAWGFWSAYRVYSYVVANGDPCN